MNTKLTALSNVANLVWPEIAPWVSITFSLPFRHLYLFPWAGADASRLPCNNIHETRSTNHSGDQYHRLGVLTSRVLVLGTEQVPLPFALIAMMCILTVLETMEVLFISGTTAIDYIVVICRRFMFKHKACFNIPTFAPRIFSPNLSLVRI